MASVLGMSFGSIVADVLSPGVSPHFTICAVRRGEFDIRANDSVVYEKGGPRPERTMPPIATSWSEVGALLRRNGVAEGDAWQAEA